MKETEKGENYTKSKISLDDSLSNQTLLTLPAYHVMADQLQQAGVMTDEDLKALDQMEAFDRTKTMTITMSRAALIEFDDDAQYVDMLERVRRHEGWKDHVYAAKFLTDSGIVLPDNSAGDVPDPEIAKYNAAQAAVDVELEELFRKQNHPQRENRIQDLIDEEYDYVPTFLHAFGIDSQLYPKTVRLIETMGFVAAMVVMPWKRHFKRPRPSQLDKDLEPAIQVPAHYSFPSGHATQAYLTYHALHEAINQNKPPDKHIVRETHISRVAREIAENREWGGLHYASDTVAGQNLALGIWDKGKNGVFKPLITQAKAEWKNPH